MKRFLLCALLAGFISVSFGQEKQLIRVKLFSVEDAKLLHSYDLDFATRNFKRFADIVATNEDMQFLRERGFEFEILDKNLRKTYQENVGLDGDMGDYHTYQEMVAEINQVHAAYPNITTITSIGQSIEGRDIWAVKVSDNPTQEEADEPDVLYVANIHAREVATPEVILYFLNYLVTNYGTDAEVTFLVDNRELWLIPTTNPDGHVYVETTDPMWRKNRRNNGDGSYGVDLNRNFGYKWGYDNSGSSPDPSSNIYRGTSAFSEPETQALRQLCMSHHFVISLMYHSYGKMWLFPWGYVPQNTPHHDVFMQIARNCVAYNGYLPGNFAMGVIYGTNGDSDDYFYGEQTEKNMIFGFTPEIGADFWPPESDLPQIVQENLGPNLYVARIAGLIAENPYRINPPAVPAINELGSDDDGNYTVSWTIQDDPVNPAVAYQLDELSGDTLVTDLGDDADARWNMHGFEISSVRANSAPKSLYSQMGDNLNHTATLKFPLIVSAGMALTFNAWYDIEKDWDYAYVEVSSDGGANYQSIPGNITTTTNPNGNNMGNGITGDSNGWAQAVFDLSGFAGQSIIVRLHYVTDAYVTGEGIYFDDIYPVPFFSNDTTLSDNLTTASFSISGKLPGTYYYRVRAKDADDQWGGWSQLEDIVVTGAPSDCQLGDVNMDGDITPGDAFCAFFRYLSGSFPADSSCSNPCAEFAADINCSPNGVTPGDALYIFRAYLNGKNPPLDCLPTNGFSGDSNTVKRNIWFEKIASSDSLTMTFGVFVDSAVQMDAFGIDIGFPDHLLKFVAAQAGEVTETWQEFDAAEPFAGVIRLGGFTGDNVSGHDKHLLAKLQFQPRDQAYGGGEIWAMNFKDDVEKAESAPLHFDLTPTSINAPEEAQKIDGYFLEQNYPNPFNMETRINYQLAAPGRVEISIFNTMGQKVRTLVSADQTVGVHELVWDGKNDAGHVLSSGVYLIKMFVNHFRLSRKILLMK
ncbi:MAG: T9SS type A sorting domain-containing protein [Calditrichaeota bacterium]|nr:T9SS type A sorting domain-containing protein [Calditrichota bacterium]